MPDDISPEWPFMAKLLGTMFSLPLILSRVVGLLISVGALLTVILTVWLVFFVFN